MAEESTDNVLFSPSSSRWFIPQLHVWPKEITFDQVSALRCWRFVSYHWSNIEQLSLKRQNKVQGVNHFRDAGWGVKSWNIVFSPSLMWISVIMWNFGLVGVNSAFKNSTYWHCMSNEWFYTGCLLKFRPF